MRKLIVTNIVSVDGYFEGPGGNVLALPMDASFDAYCAERLGTADTLLLGRNTFELFRSFWPAVADNAAASDDQREISRRDNAIDKVVISDSLDAGAIDPWTDTTRIVGRADAHQVVADLKQTSGGDILVFGSHVLWNDLLEAGLVDELHLMVGPLALGDGTPAFTAGKPVNLETAGVRSFDNSGNVVIRYTVAAAS